MDFEEFVVFLGIFYSMETIHLLERHLYFKDIDFGYYKTPNYSMFMTLNRFETVLKYLKFSFTDDPDQQILDWIAAVNKNFQRCVNPGDYLCLDEAMLKSYHKDLKGKMKIIRKPRPIGNECQVCCDAKSQIVLNIELYEGREPMGEKEFVRELGATTAVTLRLTAPWKYSGRVVVADSWFGSVKAVVNLFNRYKLYGTMLVKTAHVKFPKLMLRETEITRGEWNTLTGEVEGVPVMAVLFKDLQEKQFISSCNLSIEGEPRVTKHCGEIARPAVAETYLKNCAGIDIHNHFRTGSSGLEDVWQTKNYIHRQFAGITGFIFTNAFLAMRHFSKINGIANIRGKHAAFKHILSDQLLNFRDVSRCTRTVRLQSSQVHTLARIGERGGWG